MVAGLACNFTKSNTPPWVFFACFKLYKWHQIVQRITNKVILLFMNLAKTIFQQQQSKRNIIHNLKNQTAICRLKNLTAICRLKNLTAVSKTAIHRSEALSQKHSGNMCGLKKVSQVSVILSL